MIRCGNCHNYHETVNDVRTCSMGGNAQILVPPADRERAAEPITDRQWDYLNVLAGERGITLGLRATYCKQEASAEIKRLLAMPARPAADAQQSGATVTPLSEVAALVPAGRYALADPENPSSIRFYIVDKPTEGRWAGRTFVSVQASDEKHAVRNAGERLSILRRISVDPRAAMLLYGKEIGRCGHCGRTLTNDESRARGIGPICAGKMGW